MIQKIDKIIWKFGKIIDTRCFYSFDNMYIHRYDKNLSLYIYIFFFLLLLIIVFIHYIDKFYIKFKTLDKSQFANYISE